MGIRTRTWTGLVVTLVAVGAAAACAVEEDQVETAPAAEEGRVQAPATPAVAGYSADAIVRVLDAVNTGEIEEARLAVEKAQDDEVRQFAQMMIDDHEQLESRVGSAARGAETSGAEMKPDSAAPETRRPETGVPPEAAVARGTEAGSPEALTQRLEQQSDSVQSALEDLSGAEFDRAYIERQVRAHQATLDLIDRQLMPAAAQAPELRQVLQAGRPVIESHLEQARRIQQRLASG